VKPTLKARNQAGEALEHGLVTDIPGTEESKRDHDVHRGASPAADLPNRNSL